MFSQTGFMDHKKYKLILRRLVLALGLWLGAISLVLAQGEQIQLAALMVEIWPEYDRPETLIIYRGQLADSTPLPATVTFNLPASVKQIFAVAVLSETGELLTHPYQFDAGRLTFTLTGRNFQFEYYDPAVVKKEGHQRVLNFSAQTAYPITVLQMGVQQPLNVGSMQFDPAPGQTETGTDGQTRYFFDYQDVSAGLPINLTGAYTKPDDILIIQPEAVSPAPAATDWQLWLGYGLIGLGALVLLAVGGLWFKGRPAASVAPPIPSRANSKTPAGEPSLDSRFCYRCGVPYKPDALFCHHCGAARR